MFWIPKSEFKTDIFSSRIESCEYEMRAYLLGYEREIKLSK